MKSACIAAACLIACTLCAWAEEPRRIDFTQPFIDDGITVIDDLKCPLDKDGKRPCETPFTLGEAAYQALRFPQPPEPGRPGLSFEEGDHRADLAKLVRTAKDYPITKADLDLIKAQIARRYPVPMLIGLAAEMLGGK